MPKQQTSFRLVLRLKTIIGRELITDDFVAVFELVKNAFDAHARNVDVYFGPDSIVIADDGDGMTMEDVRSKWLFVGYSAKREQNRRGDFRDSIEARRHFAGSKGVGRMSSDRLGTLVTLQTRARNEVSGPVHRIDVDWSLFDQDHLVRFEEIGVGYDDTASSFEVPEKVRKIKHGTIITINQTRRTWDRNSILRLKAGLSKLINPFGASVDGFKIRIIAPEEDESDKQVFRDAKAEDRDPLPGQVINGEVGNFIFSTLQEKTTFIAVAISKCGQFLESSLTDRGELIYKIREPNPYHKLHTSAFSCELYFLNQSAKNTFTRRMGVPSVSFGSVFVFRNGFRVFPVGEEGDDWFKLDREEGAGVCPLSWNSRCHRAH